MSTVTPFSLGFKGARDTPKDLVTAARRVFVGDTSQHSAAAAVITPALSAALPEDKFAKRTAAAIALYVVLTICTAGIFAIVENILHMLRLSKFMELMATYRADGTSAPDSPSRRTELLKALELTGLLGHIEALARALGGINTPAPQPSPAPTITNPELKVFMRACKAVGIKDYDPLPQTKIGGYVYTTPAAAIIGQLDNSFFASWEVNFSVLDVNSDFLKVSIVLQFRAGPSFDNADYALQGEIKSSVVMGKFINLLRTYYSKKGIERWATNANVNTIARNAVEQAIHYANVLNIVDMDEYVGRDDLKGDHGSLNGAIVALNPGSTKFRKFDFDEFKVDQARILLRLSEPDGFDKDGIVGLKDVELPEPIGGSGTDAAKYRLGDLIAAIGGDGNCGIECEADAVNTAISKTEAEGFIYQVNDFRRNHGKILANATVKIEGRELKVYEAYKTLFDENVAKTQQDIVNANAAYEAAKAQFPTGE